MEVLNNLWIYLQISYESLFVLIITSLSCAIIGSFLVLRKLSMVSDAISHTVLLGIVIAFLIVKDIASPFLLFGAALFGVITVFCIELISKSGLAKNDEAVGIVFPMFFALAVVLITKFARNAHLDTDIVLMGEVIMAPLNRMDVFGISLPKGLVQMSILLVVNLVFVIIFFKELKITTFDAEYAIISGFSSIVLFYALMTLSSMTAVVAFDAVGAILVVSFLITPGASAYLICKDLKKMILVSCIYAFINSVLGYLLSLVLNVSMSGMTAVVAGSSFFLTFLFNREGLITSVIRRVKNSREFRLELMTLHIGNHMGDPDECEELGIDTIENHLRWSRNDIEKRANKLIERGIVYINEDFKIYSLTKKGEVLYNEIRKEYGM